MLTLLPVIAAFLLLAVIPALEANAQQIPRARIEGVVLDAVSGKPLEGAHVFISRSAMGAVTNAEGFFRFTLPIGAHRIVVSIIGHQTQVADILVRSSGVYRSDFKLQEEVLSLGPVTVTALRDLRREKQLERFRNAFIGVTANAKEVIILNPEAIDFEEENGRLTATAIEPLQIENRALGYHLEHHLHEFVTQGESTWQDGESLFEEMVAESESQKAHWQQNRLKAYQGSVAHFFQSVVRNESREEGFQVHLVDDPGTVGEERQSERNFAAPLQKPQFAVNPYNLLKPTETEGVFQMSFPKFVLVVYTREREDQQYADWQKVFHSGQARDMQYSWLQLRNGAATLDRQGNILEPYAFSYFGYLSFERLADLMPKEFRP